MKIRKPATRTLGVALLLALAGTSAAATNEELEARIAQLEAALAELVAAKDAAADRELDQPSLPVEQKWPDPVDADGSASHYSFGGYIKYDAMLSTYSAGDLASDSLGTQFYVPATIPVGGESSEGPDLNMQAKETRLHFKSEHELANGVTASTFIEMDFFLSPGGNQRVSNSFNPRMRHAFFQYGNWLFGQTWSTFQDVSALPENIDFIGPAESTTFMRQPMIRYTAGPFEVAVENSETTLTPNGGGARITADDGAMPDLAARYTMKLDNGYIKAAALLRNLAIETDALDDEQLAFGLSISGKHNVGANDFRWMASAGTGIGRYLGLNTSNGGVLDENGNIETIDQWGAFGSYRHLWNDKWRSNITLGYLSNDNPVNLTGTGVTKDVYSFHLNLLYSPIPKMTVGGEYIFAERQLESGDKGDMSRFQFGAKYAF